MTVEFQRSTAGITKSAQRIGLVIARRLARVVGFGLDHQSAWMPQSIQLLRFAYAAVAAVFCAASLIAITTYPVPLWTLVVVVVLSSVVAGGVALLMLHADSFFFEPLVILLPGLTVGRLLSTTWLIPAGQPAPRLSVLILGETGPGVPLFEPLTVVLVAVALIYVLAQAHRSITKGCEGTCFSSSDWLTATLRTYVGLMFISHFTGHVLAGPIPFDAFVGYFGKVGMPLPEASVVLAGLVEITVCVGLAFGLLTRIVAILGTFYLLFTVWIGGHFSIGYSWALPEGGWEFPVLWAFLVALFGIFGAGPISLDARLARRSATTT
ncbi:DoxX family protein [Glacieibacterium megasporae]|uniref:DoxX family protein n=1 Tax=Glacieibacterium megasporae TaxID=2835787 RepID=UPI001C1E0015|nr:DoxX family protein [Polymorphobacter megasporae]UAJ10572.1 DoxX family protein [Polymorphobacter megasporae]